MMKAPSDAYVAQLTKGANTKGVGNQPLAPKVLADGTKQFDADREARRLGGRAGQDRAGLDVQRHGARAVDQGRRRRQGAHRPRRTSCRSRPVVHFHGIEVPNAMDGVPDVTQPPIKPGETFTYEFVAQGPALGMYHSHHHAEDQVPTGCFGVFQVGDVAAARRAPARSRRRCRWC